MSKKTEVIVYAVSFAIVGGILSFINKKREIEEKKQEKELIDKTVKVVFGEG